MGDGRARHRVRIKVGVALVAAVVLLLALAAPALAAPAATTWTVSPTSTTITYGQGVTLNGTMMSNGAAVVGLWVDFAQATTQSGSYQIIYKVTTLGGPYATGAYSVAVMPLQTMYYRFSYAGDTNYALSTSDVIPVQVKPSLGTPSGPTSIKVNKKFTLKGSVKPGAPSGPKVQIKAWKKKSNGSWAGYKTYSTQISGTQYSASIKITQTGKYKFKAISVASAQYASGETGYSKVLSVTK